MPAVTRCNHCGVEGVFEVDDPKHQRMIFVCLNCNRWGVDRSLMSNPLPKSAKISVKWPQE
jgi:hypothetical protein